MEVAVGIWGSGKPMGKFLWGEDMAGAYLFLAENRDFKDTFCNSKPVNGQNQNEVRNTHIKIETGKVVFILLKPLKKPYVL